MEFFNDVGGDPLKPSLFELLAQEQLRDLLQPALRYVLSVFAQRYPRYLLRLVNRHEEFYGLLMYFVERHYLRTRNASFAESFYGLKRRRTPWVETERARAAVGVVPEGEKLRPREIRRSLLFLILIPYLRAKAHDYFEELGGGAASDLPEDERSRQSRALADPTFKGHIRRWFKMLYPCLNLSFELWLMAYNVAYLVDATPNYRPWLSWIRVDLRRLSIEDLHTASLASPNMIQPPHPQGLLSTARQFLLKSPRFLLDSLRILLPTAIFFIKFLEWWYSPGSPARALVSSPAGPSIPPPRILLPHPKGVPFDRTQYGQCPLCHEPFKNATALPSGYVFCYRCAYDHVSEHGQCPVTLLHTQIWQLRKILV